MNIHRSINTLSIFAYNQIAETHDFGYLIIDRTQKTDRNILPGAWSEIVSQYADATSHRESIQEILDLQKAILEISINYNNIKTLIFCCRKCFDSDVIDELNSYGFDINSKKDLLIVERSIKTMLTQRREYEFELSQKLIKPTNNVSFEQTVDRICDYKKRTINTRETTVKEWIAIEDNYIKDMKKNK